MPNLEAQAAWVPVREIGIELARGGPNGNMNEQATALLARTEWLNQQKASKSEIVQGHYEFNTYAEFNAIKSTLPLNCTVIINEIPTGTQTWGQGTNLWNGTTLTKSAHDPLTQAKLDATTKANAAEENAKEYANSKLDFVSNLPENNQFIRELYITGWNGTDEIYVMGLTNSDNGKVTINVKNKTANRDVIYTYQKPAGQQIYALETSGNAAGSGFGGYIAIDWNAYSAAISAQGAYIYKVSKKALNLVNCPFIKEYIDVTAINATVATNASDIAALKASGAYHSTLAATATHTQAKLINNFVANVKLLNGHIQGFSYYITNIELIAGGVRVNLKYYDPANPNLANPWASYNFNLLQGSNTVDTYEVKYNNYRWLVTLDWNHLAQISVSIGGGSLTSTPLNMERLFEKDINYFLRSQPNFYKVGNLFKDGQSKLNHIFANAVFSANVDTNYSYTVEKVADGTRVVLSNTNANVNRRFRFAFTPFYVRIPDTYFAYVKFTINSVSGTTNAMSMTLSKSGKSANTDSSFFDNIRAGQTYEEVRKIVGDSTGAVATDGSMFFDFWSASNSAAGIVLDITIHDIRLLYNYGQDTIFLNKERKEIEQLVRALGYFEEEVSIPKFVDNALSTQNINRKLEMQSLGDSTSVMVMWQERLAQMKGWHFNRTMAINGLNGGYPVALGGSWCEPIISNFGATGNAGQNHYTRSSSIADYGIDVLFVLSSYNGQHIGKAWQTGGQLVKSDHGINDEPYHGGEVNLITNPTADFPSFGASYYGMLEKIMTANPNTRIVLLTLYLFNVTRDNLANILAKNAVIRKAAEKYNLQLIDLEKISGINSFTASTLCFEGGVHINQKGGDRLAQVIGGLV